jgi:hypothetical protein
METIRIFVSLRDLRFGSGADFGRDGRDHQCCHCQERYRRFINVIIHTIIQSKRYANGAGSRYTH